MKNVLCRMFELFERNGFLNAASKYFSVFVSTFSEKVLSISIWLLLKTV